MTFNANDQPILVAPRPVRLSSVFVSRSHYGQDTLKVNEVGNINDFQLSLVAESTVDADNHGSRPLSR